MSPNDSFRKEMTSGKWVKIRTGSLQTVWQERFTPLAMFNADVARGVIHTKEYQERMNALQTEYNARLQSLQYTGDVGKYHLFKNNPLAEEVQPEDKTEEVFPSATGTID